MVAEGYLAPRRSMRRLIEGGYGICTALAFLALGYLVQSILVIVFGGTNGGIGTHLANAGLQVAAFFMLSGLIYALGRAAGGKGTLAGAQLVVGWHALVTSPLSPLTIGLMPAGEEAEAAAPAGVGVLALVYIGLSFWLLANYVAELHQFRNTWSVLAALVGFSFAAGILLLSIIGAFTQS